MENQLKETNQLIGQLNLQILSTEAPKPPKQFQHQQVDQQQQHKFSNDVLIGQIQKDIIDIHRKK